MLTKVTVGIAGYYAENNIIELLESVLAQKGNFELASVFVNIDNSGDDTLSLVKKFQNNLVNYELKPIRQGFAKAIQNIFAHSTAEITVILNDDIKITDHDFLEKLILPFTQNANTGMVCGKPKPLPAKTFLERSITASHRAYEKMSQNLRDGNNYFTCDGKVMAFSKNYVKNILETEKFTGMGNVDSYLYLFALDRGFLYRYCPNAYAYYLNPSTAKEYIAWSTRNNSHHILLQKRFPGLYEKESKKPAILWKYMLEELLKHPLEALYIFSFRIIIFFKKYTLSRKFPDTWENITSTKRKV